MEKIKKNRQRLFFLMVSFLIISCSTVSPVQTPTATDPQTTTNPQSIDAPSTPISDKWNGNELNDYISSQNNEILICYEDVKIKYPDISGAIVIRAKFHPEGYVEDFVVVKDSIQNALLTDCIKQKVLKWKTPKVAKGNRSVWLEIPYEFETFYGHSGANQDSIRTDEELFLITKEKQIDLEKCLTRYLPIGFSGELELDISFSIQPNGRLENISIKTSNIPDTKIENCMVDQMKTLRFRPIKQSKNQDYVIRFQFNK